jgi:hypothetical protein
MDIPPDIPPARASQSLTSMSVAMPQPLPSFQFHHAPSRNLDYTRRTHE